MCSIFIFVLALALPPFASCQPENQPPTQADMHLTQKANDLSSGYRYYSDPISGKGRYLIGSISSEALNEGYFANETEIEPTNATEITNVATKDIIIPTKKECQSCVFYINSAEELRININNTNCAKKIFFLESGKYDGPFYIGNNASNITIKPDPSIKGSVIFDAMNNDFNFAIDSTSNVSINGLTLKNGNNGVLLEKVKNCLIDGNKIYNFKFNGIYINNSVENISIINNTIVSNNYQNNVSGITLSESKDVIIADNEIRVGNENPDFNINGNGFIDILINNSVGNLINFNGNGIITEDAIKCGVKCNGNTPTCSCESMEDDCQYFIGMSCNSWSFKC